MLDTLLRRLATDPTTEVDLAEVSLRLAIDEYPDLDIRPYLSQIDAWADTIAGVIPDNLDIVVGELMRVLFEEEGFTGNVPDYFDPRNSYLNDVIDRRLGIPITLSILAIAIGQRIGVEIVGLALPGHFIAKAIDGKEEILFDPFNRGDFLTTADCEHLVETATGKPFVVTRQDLSAAPPRLIVTRLLNNLRVIYTEVQDFPRLARAGPAATIASGRRCSPAGPGCGAFSSRQARSGG